MQVTSLGEHLLVSHSTDIEILHSTNLAFKQVFHSEKLCIFSVDISYQELKRKLRFIKQLSLQRYLDKFYIWTSNEDSKKRQEVLDCFFQKIATEYESLVDVQRNQANISNLLKYLDFLISRKNERVVVDYGCGTGLSIVPAASYNFKLIGIDRCPKMRQIAASKGMDVWSIGELARKPHNLLDGAFASYVFHLLPHTHGLRLLWSRLKVGGVLVANFHKNHGIDLIGKSIQDVNGNIIELKFDEKHGSYFAYRKEN